MSLLEIRPLNRRKAERIRGDVFVCVLSLILSRIMEKLSGRTINSIRVDLNFLDVVPVIAEKREIYISSESSVASGIMKILGLPYPRIRESAHT